MSLPADFDLKERVRASVDIVDVVGSTLELQPAGRNFVTRCPWHNDRRPSLTINQERQTWKCWVCDIGGDIFSYVMQRDGVDFPTALRSLAELAGIEVDEFRGKKTVFGSPDDKATLLAAMKLVSDAYFEQLESGKSDDSKIAREYLASRGIDDENRKRFHVGFSPESWSFAVDLLRKKNFSGEVAEAAGLAIARNGGGHYDRFRGRLMFPIHDLQDRPISLGGRVIPAIASKRGDDGGGAKYINGPETRLFRKSHQLYGLQLAREAIRRSGEVLVMEGYTDVVAARQAGVESAVAVLGTALGEDHIKLLKRFSKRVVLVLDGDTAGQTRADQVLDLFVRADVDLRVLTLPEGSDPADFLASHGRSNFDELVAKAPDALEHKLNRLTDGVDVTNDTHQVTTAIESLLGIVAQVPSHASSGMALKVDQLMLRMSRTFGITAERLNQRLEQLRKAKSSSRSYTKKANPTVRRVNAPPPSKQPTRPAPSSRPLDPNDAFAEASDYDPDLGDYGVTNGGIGNATAIVAEAAPLDRLTPLSGVDRELFETLIESPALAAMAVESIDPDWFESNTAKMLLSAYQDLDLDGRDLSVDSLLLVLENELLKNQVVTLEERVRRRGSQSTQTPEQRYATIILSYRQREILEEKSRQIAKLETLALAEDEEEALLKSLFDAERSRHAIDD
ncbi:DNA primase [Planctomycetes bacterium CA13]|uniref:DNA primase n=1 Tax=Novipirellula herctigrandis TaxID=2527986 RepID=A0A5C5YXW1_9BACT|nr:DNA primase [Planctomycetes bacterium CA13]